MKPNPTNDPTADNRTPDPGGAAALGTLTDKEAFELVRDGIKHEDDLTHQRLTWLLTAEAFFLTGFGVLAGILFAKEPPPFVALAGGLVLVLFSFAAIRLCQIIQYAVDAADAHLHLLKNWWYERLDPRFNAGERRRAGSAGNSRWQIARRLGIAGPRIPNRSYDPWKRFERCDPLEDKIELSEPAVKVFPPVMGWFQWRHGLGVCMIPGVFLALNSLLFLLASLGLTLWLADAAGLVPPGFKKQLHGDKAPQEIRLVAPTNAPLPRPQAANP